MAPGLVDPGAVKRRPGPLGRRRGTRLDDPRADGKDGLGGRLKRVQGRLASTTPSRLKRRARGRLAQARPAAVF